MVATQWLLDQIYVILLMLICRSIAATGDRYDDLYNSMFQFSQHPLSLDEMNGIIDQLVGLANTKGHDPRVYEIAFWKRTSELKFEKCNFAEFKTLRSRLDKARYVAESIRHEQGATGRIFNLEAYYHVALDKLMSFCSALIPGLYYHLQESTKSLFKDLVELATDARHYSRLSPYRIGANMARLILKNSSKSNLEQLSRSLGDINLVKAIYEQYTPCIRLIEAVESHRGIFDLVAKASYYPLKKLSFPCPQTKSGHDNMNNYVERVEVCRYINGHRKVFAVALEHIVSGAKMIRSLARVQSKLTNDDRYNMIFRFSPTQLNYYEVKGALSVLNSLSNGLPESDPRRTEIAFWFTTALQYRVKCAKDDDDILRLNLEFDKERAAEAGSSATPGAAHFNLETFVEGVRARRLDFCEENVGVFLIHELDKVKNKRALDIGKLTADIHHAGTMDVDLLSRRVAELIKRRDPNIQEGQSLLSTAQIKRLYRQYSPCPPILRSMQTRLYSDFYDLATNAENYERLSKQLKNWIDVISVCRFIELESEQVFENAANVLYIHL